MVQKIAVLGTGANGSCAAADLSKAGHDVHLIDQWPEHVEVMRRDGVKISMPDEELCVPVEAYHLCDLASMTCKYDVVFLFTKSYDTRWACELIKPYLHREGLLVGVQNAMTVDDIVEIVGEERTLGCVIELSSEIFTPGLVKRNTPHSKTWFGVGNINPKTLGREKEITELLSHVGKVSISEDIISAKWMKLIINTMCLAPIALTGLSAAEGPKLPGMREMIFKIGTEALNVGQALGYRIQPIFGLTQDEVKDTNRLLETLFEKLLADIGPAARDCTLQDHLKGRKSEVEDINGLIVKKGKEVGAVTRCNSVIVEVTRRIELGELSPSPSTFEIAKSMINNLDKSTN